MAPLLFALALMTQDAPAEAPPSPDAPMATAVPRKQVAAPLPIQGGTVSAPTDDYGYVAWCYGAISSYIELYDRAMPEVIRIERAWPTPSTEENITQVYPAQREEGKRNLVLFARAMQAAEKASPTPIQDQGLDGVRRGRAMWTGATSVPKAQLAQFWMSWSPPAKCEETAKALEKKSLLFGQALSFNATPVAAPAAPVAAQEEAAPTLAAASTETPVAPQPVEASTTVAELAPQAAPAPTPAPEPAAEPAGGDVAPAGDAPMVEATPLPSEDPEVAVSGDPAPAPSEPVIDAAALSAGAPEPAASTESGADAAPTAIDDLLPVSEPQDAPTVTEEAQPTVAAKPAEPAKPAPPKRKRGLKETLQGMRGRQ